MVSRGRLRSSETGTLLNDLVALSFGVSDWVASTDTYDLLFAASKHGRGSAELIVEVFELDDGESINVTDGVEVIRELSSGDVMLRVNRNAVGFENRFAGQLVIW